MRKKVLLLVTKSNYGGAQRYVCDLAKSLDKNQYDVAVGAGGHGALFDRCHESGTRTIRLPHLDRDISIFKEIKAFFALYSIIRKENPDIVHLNSPKMGGIGGTVARLRGVPEVIYTNHGWTFHEDRPWWQKVIIKIFSWIIVILSTKTIVLSNREKNDACNWPLIEDKIMTIPLGIESLSFIPREEARVFLYSQSPLTDNGNKIILSIGELTRNKNYIAALRAMNNLPNCHYFIIGDGELRIELEKYIHAHNLQDRVSLLGYIPDAAKYMKAADIYLLPSLKEGLPYVLLEALQAEIPIIATNVGGIPELLADSGGIIIPPKNPQAIIDAIASSPQSGGTSERYTLDRMAKETEALYN